MIQIRARAPTPAYIAIIRMTLLHGLLLLPLIIELKCDIEHNTARTQLAILVGV
jgi:hypothetical protein